jgi:hypothetical protein
MNQLTQTASTTGPTLTFTYANGNLTSDGAHSFAYDAESHLTGMGTTSLSYDPFGRLMNVTASAATNFAYDGLNMIAEYNGSSLSDRYVFGTNMDEPIVAYDASGNRSTIVPQFQSSPHRVRIRRRGLDERHEQAHRGAVREAA